MKYLKLFEEFNNVIIAYHGTNKDFDNFDLNFTGSSNDDGDFSAGIYFDTNKEWASAYAHKKIGFLITAEIILKKPYCINFKNYSSYKKEYNDNRYNPELLKYIKTLKVVFVPDKQDTFLTISRHFGSDTITDILTKQGYDGVIVDYGNSKEIVVFDSNDINIIKKEKLSDIVFEKFDYEDDEKELTNGIEHKVYTIDDNFVLKLPKHTDYNLLKSFDYHIKFMQAYPDIFPNVKRLDKYRASIEKVDTLKAKEEIQHFYDVFCWIKDINNIKSFSGTDEVLITTDMYNKKESINDKDKKFYHTAFVKMIEYAKKNNDLIIKRYCDFMNKLKETFGGKYLDIHNDNIGIDKNGNIKLIDF